MKRVTNLFIAIAMAMAALPSLAQYPANFAWPAGDPKDQQEQGPCHIFAAAAAAESWFKILYGSMPDISEAHLYSPCAGAGAGTTGINEALNFMKLTGAVDGGVNSGCLPYVSGAPCNVGTIPANPFFAAQVTSSQVPDCGTPWCNCDGNTSPTQRFRVADFQELNIAAMSNADDLRRALLNHGPIALWFLDTSLHSLNHAYMLYGWSGNNAMLKDSWPGLPNANNQGKTLAQIITLFQNSAQFKAFTLKRTSGNEAVYKQSRSGGSWQTDTTPVKCIAGPSNLFTISSNPNREYITYPPVSYSISGPFSLYDNPTVVWSYESQAGNGAVSFSPPTGTSTTASYAGGDGTGYVVASIKRPNGVCESYRRFVYVSAGIPFSILKTYDYCPGSYRAIEYTASSPISGLTYNWTFYPSPGTTHYTYVNNYATSSKFLMHLYTLPTGYGLGLSITDSSYPGASNGSTNGGYGQSCGGWFIANDDDRPKEAPEKVSAYPVPAARELSIDLYDDELYELKLINKYGSTLLSVTGKRTFKLDVSQVEKGVHLLRLIPKDKSGKVITKRIVVE